MVAIRCTRSGPGSFAALLTLPAARRSGQHDRDHADWWWRCARRLRAVLRPARRAHTHRPPGGRCALHARRRRRAAEEQDSCRQDGQIQGGDLDQRGTDLVQAEEQHAPGEVQRQLEREEDMCCDFRPDLFMHRMALAVEAQTGVALSKAMSRKVRRIGARESAVARGVEVFSLSGPFFFGAAAHFEQMLARTGGRPRVLIVRMDDVPLMDSTGADAQEVRGFCARQGHDDHPRRIAQRVRRSARRHAG